MAINYRRANAQDSELLAKTRVEFIVDDNWTTGGIEVSEKEKRALYDRNLAYFRQTLASGDFIAFLAFAEEQLIGTSGLSFYRMAPTLDCIDGRIADILNMYTVPAYRRQGIATRLFEMAFNQAKDLGYHKITLSASQAGRPLYEKFGFQAELDAMVYHR